MRIRRLFYFIIVVIALGWGIRMLLKGCESHMTIGANADIGPSPTQIASIRDIGQWEFLAIDAEELVDTTRRGFFSDDHLVRIYYGTLRLGIDLNNVREDWMTRQGDSLQVILPEIALLDEHFIDEARTRSFYESGKWTARDREAMYLKAVRQMRSHCMTEQNLLTARQNGTEQMRKLLRAMGYNKVAISFSD